MNKLIITPLVMALGLAGCATQKPSETAESTAQVSDVAPAPVITGSTPTSTSSGGGQNPKYPLFRYIDIVQDGGTTCTQSVDGFYTRLEAVSELTKEPGKGLNKQSVWSTFLNALRTKTHSAHFIARPEVSTFNTEMPVPLLTIYEENGSKGQAISREAALTSFMTPYFRVDPSTTAHIAFEFKAQSSTKTPGVRLLFKTLKKISGYLAPGSDLFTTLNKDSVKEEAHIVENALTGLLTQSLDETASFDLQLACWQNTITAKLRLDNPDKDENGTLKVGHWDVSAAAPKISVFSTATYDLDSTTKAQQIKAAVAGVDESAVLNLTLTKDVSLGSYITQQAWYSDVVTEISSTTDATVKTGLAKLCHRSTKALYGLGLNNTDATLGYWAVSGTLLNLKKEALAGVTGDIEATCGEKAENIFANKI